MCRKKLGDGFTAADAAVQARVADEQLAASLERLTAVAAQDPALSVQARLQAAGIVLPGVFAARPFTGSSSSDKAAANRTKRPISAAELGSALGDGAEIVRQHSRPSSVSSASGSRRGSAGNGVRMQTVQLALDIA